MQNVADKNLRRVGGLRHEQRRHGFRFAQSWSPGRVYPNGTRPGPNLAEQIDIVSTHATGTTSGDAQESEALRRAFGGSSRTRFNNTKSYIGHAMGAAGALELAGNLGAFDDGVCHPTINLERLDPECRLEGLVAGEPRKWAASIIF